MRILALLMLAFASSTIWGDEAAAPVTAEAALSAVGVLRDETNWLWTCIAGFLVFFMQAGFSLVEAGFTRAKNTVNILMKNFMDFALGSLAYWLIGFSILFGPQLISGFGFGGPSLADSFLLVDGKPDAGKFTFFIFQLVFAGTAATIVSGAMAERTKFVSYIVFSILITAFVYPVFGSLAWANLFGINKGYLEELGFIDFAGSTVVHSVGGWAGLAGAVVLGPRLGKYQDGKVVPILGHNMTIAALGVFILWLGWFGFNPGSTTSVGGGTFAIIAVTTNFAAAAGAAAAMIATWILFKKPDIGLTLNGALAGLVAITAPCANVSISSAIIIGAIGGVLVVFSVLFFDKIKVDDPVGAVSVHGVCGAWGTIAAGLFAEEAFGGVNGLFFGGGISQLWVQLTGVGIGFAWAFGASLLIFLALKYTIGLRVSEDEEIQGLDILEHGNEAYPISK
ncbi:ammonium transporter [Leptospira wolffii]|uniref:ammonium transporter n=1 Tax=Leptospira wolffii TaxID=409998 RepID=UPI001082FEB2|nr:ammonium transporter [Leptospira wolffii]TGL49431.1 ammonium transporter [Leptospira wolffii]